MGSFSCHCKYYHVRRARVERRFYFDSNKVQIATAGSRVYSKVSTLPLEARPLRATYCTAQMSL